MARRGSRITRKSGTSVEGGSYRTYPSGTTITRTLIQSGGGVSVATTVKSGSTGTFDGIIVKPSGVSINHAGIDFGGGLFAIRKGVAPLGTAKNPTGGTTLSVGTMTIATGLTDVQGFIPSLSGLAASGCTIKGTAILLSWQRKGLTTTTNGGVTVYLAYAGASVSGSKAIHDLSAVTRNTRLRAGGSSLSWLAFGTI